jgi:hypothetical protein
VLLLLLLPTAASGACQITIAAVVDSFTPGSSSCRCCVFMPFLALACNLGLVLPLLPQTVSHTTSGQISLLPLR